MSSYKRDRVHRTGQRVANVVTQTDELLRSEEESKINDPELSQSLCTILQVALVNLLRRFDVKPSAVVGHSSGEIAAA